MSYWKEKEEYEEKKVIKSKCPMNKNIEVVWKFGETCSFSGHSTCKRCIKKGDYPIKELK